MGNVVSGLNNDGENSQLFMGNYHNVGSSVSNFTSDKVNFTGSGQNVEFNGSGQTVTFGSGVKVTYNSQPIFSKGVVFNDSNNITVGGSQLFQNGLINPILIPSNLPIKTVSDFTNLSSTGTINSNNLITTGYSQASNVLYVGTGPTGYEDAPFKVSKNGDVTTSGNLSASSVSAINLYGPLTGNVVGNVTGNLKGNVVGDVTGNLTGNLVSGGNISASSITGKVLYGPLSGDVTGNLKGNVTGDVTGNLKGNVAGDITGNLKGNVAGNVTGNLTGNVKGNVIGDVTGNVTGDLAGNVTGNLKGNVTGDLRGNVEGNLKGNVEGNVIGDVTGNLKGNVEGNVKGMLEGDINGGNVKATTISASTISAENGLLTTSMGSATNGPSGGLKINGRNNWIIGENSTGQLCFYNTTSGLENAANVPFVCISATGFLVKGDA
jgi:hypothetical protein